LIIDFSRVLVFARTEVPNLEHLHAELAAQPGYRPGEHFQLNIELLSYLRKFSTRWPLYLFTDGHLHTLPEFEPVLKGIFRTVVTAEELGFKKTEPEAYMALAYHLGYAPSSLVFIDAKSANITAAAAAGLITHLYHDNTELITFLDRAQQ
jgi:HAD superfamily hydrolase (TIGR01509 family)